MPDNFIDVRDVGRLHVVSLANRDVRGERIFAAVAPFSFDDIIDVLRKLCPKRKWEDYPGDGGGLNTYEGKGRAEALLEEAYGCGFAGFQECVKGNAADLMATG